MKTENNIPISSSATHSSKLTVSSGSIKTEKVGAVATQSGSKHTFDPISYLPDPELAVVMKRSIRPLLQKLTKGNIFNFHLDLIR
jgi:hypothetical protein